MTKSKTTTSEIRMEDLGKQLLANAEPIKMDVVEKEIKNYLEELKSKMEIDYEYLLLFSKELGYHQVFVVPKGTTEDETSKWIVGYLQDSVAFADDEKGTKKVVSMADVTQIEKSTDEENSGSLVGLDIWVRTYYFQLMPFDWAFETVGDESVICYTCKK